MRVWVDVLVCVIDFVGVCVGVGVVPPGGDSVIV